MPNTEVKLINAESTWPEAAREDRKLLIKKLLHGMCGSFFVPAALGFNRQAQDCFRLLAKKGSGKREGERGCAWLCASHLVADRGL